MSHSNGNNDGVSGTTPRARRDRRSTGVALIHLLDAHDTFISAPYKGWLYVGLIAAR